MNRNTNPRSCVPVVSILLFSSLMIETSYGQMEDIPDLTETDFFKNREKPSYFYSAPQVDLQDKGSWHMPPKYRCDACLAVGYQFQKQFYLEEMRRSKRGVPLTESQIIDVADKLCSKGFQRYGAKTVNNRPRLSGEGLKAYYEYGMTGIGPGFIQRMQGLCQEVVGLLEEETLYEMYLNRGEHQLAENICRSFCTKVEMQEYKDDLKTMDLSPKNYKEDE
ncbi:marginal zone B- and B1-cell-specific protein [Biomphalaria glabrata]|uniref:Marginal zone B- and B1-cell-specific protein-like n=1 Tax=Biomphalaria glabrata TaxID=6526 RepID=A0A9U8E6Q0_BIOGL|nr:marginal zone B- and B1-cell-specific protein-like [Biomphalaria glabrata]KAI8768871.1 marginal zone B- and B1-cell-specific protein-like [Biomphalaria glabrata]KAI8787759.1 marginal zone B- and B1-cell-specific protein [Biomphalaria glabrata]